MIIKSSNQIKLLHYPLTRSVRVLWTLYELYPNGGFEIQKVEVTSGAMFDPEMLKLNPNHALPVIIIKNINKLNNDPLVMFESGAICLFLADTIAPGKLTPLKDDTILYSDFLMNYFWVCAHVDVLLWDMRVQLDFLDKDSRSQASVDRAAGKINDEVVPQILNKIKENNGYLCKFGFSLADIVLGQCITWGRKYDQLTELRSPEIISYIKNLSKRPAFKLAYADKSGFKDVNTSSL